MTADRLAVLVDDELGEVPLDAIGQHATLLLLEIHPERMGRLAIHVDLLEQIKLDFSVLHEALNVLGISGLLITELVAWKSCDTQA